MNSQNVIVQEALNDESFEGLFNDCYKQLWATALFQTHNIDDANDVVQETSILAFKNFNNLHEKRYFKTWITRILLNNVKKLYRSRRTLINQNFDFIEVFAIDQFDQKEDSIACFEAIQSLNKETGQIIILKYFSGYTVPEISRILKIPEGTIKSKLSRGIEKMKLMLKE